jgi:hypothetical protein
MFENKLQRERRDKA